MSSLPAENSVNHDETDPVMLLLDRGPPPLEENSFRTMVSNLTGWCPGYSFAVTTGLETDMDDVGVAGSSQSTTLHDLVPTGNDTANSRTVGESGSRDGDLVLRRDTHPILEEFMDVVQRREMNRSADVSAAVLTLTDLSFPQDPHKGPTGAAASMKQVIHEFGSKSGNAMHLTKHCGLQVGGKKTYVCSSVCGGGVSCKGDSCEFAQKDLAVMIPHTRQRGIDGKCPARVM